MSWDLQLEEASFGGYKFEVEATDDSYARRFAQYQFPWRDGADIDDMGRGPRSTRLTAVFQGADYESKLGGFIALVDTGETMLFIHPILGQYDAKINIGNVRHSPDDRDACTVDIEVIEDGTSTQLDELFSIESLEDEVTAEIDDLEDANVGVADVTSAITRARQFVSEAQSKANQIVSEINQVARKIDKAVDAVQSMTDVENYRIVRACKRVNRSCQKLGIRIQQKRPPIRKKAIPATVPLIVLAQLLYGKNAEIRASELAEMNNVRHMLFINAGDLKVYSK